MVQSRPMRLGTQLLHLHLHRLYLLSLLLLHLRLLLLLERLDLVIGKFAELKLLPTPSNRKQPNLLFCKDSAHKESPKCWGLVQTS